MARRPTNTQNTPENGDWDDNAADANTGLTEDQLDALDPLASEEALDEAARRNELPNRQTRAEFESGRDPVSGTLNPGIVEASGHTQQGGPDSDMSGRPPFPDPAGAVDDEATAAVRKVLSRAVDQDRANIPESHTPEQRKAAEQSAGWRTLRDMPGVHAATLAKMVKDGVVERGHAPGMHHSADAGAQYRLAQK